MAMTQTEMNDKALAVVRDLGDMNIFALYEFTDVDLGSDVPTDETLKIMMKARAIFASAHKTPEMLMTEQGEGAKLMSKALTLEEKAEKYDKIREAFAEMDTDELLSALEMADWYNEAPFRSLINLIIGYEAYNPHFYFDEENDLNIFYRPYPEGEG